MKNFLYKRVGMLTFIWVLIIFILCATPGQYIPSADWLDLLSFDKWVHAGMFFTLGCLTILLGIKNLWKRLVILAALTACVLYGGLLEIMQARYFNQRSADWMDFAANSFGCLLALLVSAKIRVAFVRG